MNEGANDLDQSEEETSEEATLAYEVSDDAMEAAAGKGGVADPTPTFWTSSCYAACCQR